MAYQKQTFIDYPNNGYTVLKAEHLNKIQDAVYNLDQALDSKLEKVEKTYYSSNRFDKNTIEFTKPLYIYNRLSPDYMFSYQTTTAEDMAAGAGWLNIPVESGKTYTMKINPVTLTDFYDYKYGYFMNLFFVDSKGTLVTNVSYGGNTYYFAIGQNDPDTAALAETAYNTNKIVCQAYGGGSNTRNGMGTDAVTFKIVDKSIAFMHIQLGYLECPSPIYQLDTTKEFIQAKKGLTDEQVQALVNSFQINEGSELLEYEEGGDYTYIVEEVQSNLTKLQNAFIIKQYPSTNLLDPNYSLNHRYVWNGGLDANGCPILQDSSSGPYPSAILKIPVTAGSYVLNSKAVKINNATFGYFGKSIFVDSSDKFVCSNYGYTSASGVSVGIDPSKVNISGEGTMRLTFNIIDPSIAYVYIPLLCLAPNGSINDYGLWVSYEPITGLTDEELYNLVYRMTLNQGNQVQQWMPYDQVEEKTVVTPEYIDGLDTFMEDIDKKMEEGMKEIEESLSEIKSKEQLMTLNMTENEIYIRAKRWRRTKDFVWRWLKVNPHEDYAGNKFLNMTSMYEMSHNLEDENTSSLALWKSAGDDITPVNFNSTYIGANHGYSCCTMATAKNHGKTEVDIGSVWLLGSSSFVLISIPDKNRLRLQHFNDTKMSSGNFGSWTSCTGTLVHSSGATHTEDIVVTESSMCQLYRSFNNYSIDVLVDEQSVGIDAIGTFTGNRIDIITQYNIIYLPAMINYLIENVGSNTNESQFSEDIKDYYITLYVDYQFNCNGSLSTYSSFYVNKNLQVGYFGLVQSIAPSNPVYTYLPDTITWQSLVEQTGAATQTFNKSDWTSSDKVPYRYYQFTNTNAEKGVALVFDRTIGWGNNEIRKNHIGSNCGMCYTSRKLYPSFISGGTLSPGTYFDGMAARVPLYKYDPDLTSIGWYWSGDDIHLMIDTHQAVNKDIVLPDYMNNMKIEILDKTDSCTFGQTYIFNSKLRFISSGYGYLVLRLYK